MPVTQALETSPASDFVLRAPDYIDARVLAANTAEQHTIPADARVVIFSLTGDFFAKYGTNPTATVPAADITDGTGSELNPTARYVRPGEKISLIASDTVTITMAFFR